jgi:hypothetical protein
MAIRFFLKGFLPIKRYQIFAAFTTVMLAAVREAEQGYH